MFGFIEQKNIVFKLNLSAVDHLIEPKSDIKTKIVPLNQLNPQQWRDLRHLQGWVNVSYLKLRYGSSKTFLLLAYAGTECVYVGWIVPSEKISSRYPFVSEDSYSIISCLTARNFRGLWIYPSQLQYIAKTGISSKGYWIWSAEQNVASLRGIQKAGGIEVGKFLRRKWLWGLMSKVDYQPRAE